MSELVVHTAMLRQHVDYLRKLRPRVAGVETLREDPSLCHDVLHSLAVAGHLAGDVALDLASRCGVSMTDRAAALGALAECEGFSPDLIDELASLPTLDQITEPEDKLDRALRALDRLAADDFLLATARLMVRSAT